MVKPIKCSRFPRKPSQIAVLIFGEGALFAVGKDADLCSEHPYFKDKNCFDQKITSIMKRGNWFDIYAEDKLIESINERFVFCVEYFF